jgi:hypothetical protein
MSSGDRKRWVSKCVTAISKNSIGGFKDQVKDMWIYMSGSNLKEFKLFKKVEKGCSQ